MSIAAFKAKYVVLEPVLPASVPNGAYFLDSTNSNAPTIKSSTGVVGVVNSTASNTNPFIKTMESSYNGVILPNTPIAKLADGSIYPAESDVAENADTIGVTIDTFSGIGEQGTVFLLGPSVANAIEGLGFTPGDVLYLSPTTGYTNDPTDLDPSINSIIKLGVADCSAGAKSATAKDIILFPEVISTKV